MFVTISEFVPFRRTPTFVIVSQREPVELFKLSSPRKKSLRRYVDVKLPLSAQSETVAFVAAELRTVPRPTRVADISPAPMLTVAISMVRSIKRRWTVCVLGSGRAVGENSEWIAPFEIAVLGGSIV